MKKNILIALAMLAVPVVMTAQEASNEALGFSVLDYSPVSLSMAGATLTDTSSVAYSVFGNPSMLPLSKKKMDVSVSYLQLTPSTYKTNDFSIGASGRIKNFGIALGFAYSACPTVDKFQEKDMLLGLGLAYKFADFISLGVNGKYAKQTFSAKNSYGAFVTDIYLGGKVKGFGYSLGVNALGGKLKSGKKTYSLPTSLALGLGYDALIGKVNAIAAHVDADYYFSKAFAAAIGLQYSFKDMLFVRGGYRIGGNSVVPSYGSAGLGFKIKGFHIDAAYLFGKSALKNTFSVGLGYCF